MFRARKLSLVLVLIGLVLITLSSSAEAARRGRGSRGGGRSGGRRVRRVFNPQRNFLGRNNQLFNPFFFNGFNPFFPFAFNPFVDPSFGFGHNGGGIDPRFTNAFDSRTLTGPDCRGFNFSQCGTENKPWRCWGGSIVADGTNKCRAVANIKWNVCRTGVEPALMSTVPMACVGAHPDKQLGNFDVAKVSGQIVIVANSNWPDIKSWLEGRGITAFKRFGERMVWTVQVPADKELETCQALVNWKPNWIKSCDPNLFTEGGASLAGTGSSGGGYGY